MYKKGTVILTPFPFTDLSGTKVRPAIIVSKGLVGDDVVVIFLTSQKNSKGTYLAPLKPSQENGLRTPSKAVCHKIATLDKKVVLGEIGTVEKDAMSRIDKKIRTVLAL
jgi:mRNA interferase MazF